MPVFLSGSLIVTGSMTTSGTITAQTLVVQTITSSIVNMTGSNRFGGQLTDRQTFTGSVLITGSLTVNTTGTEFQVTNNGVVMGNLLVDSHSVTGSLRVTGSGTFTSTISAIGESTLFQGAYNDPVPNTVAVLKMSSIPTPSLASTVVGARMSGNATANVDTYAGYFSNISTVSGTGLAYGIFATASFHTFIGETRFAQGVFNDPINGTAASIKISATPRSGAPTAVFTTGITGTASSGQNTFAGYFTNTSTVSGGGVNYGIYAIGNNHYFSGSSLEVFNNQNSTTILRVNNTSTGNAAQTSIQLGNASGSNVSGLALFGGGFTNSGLYLADGLYIYNNRARGGITIATEQLTDIVLATNATTRLTIASTGAATFSSTVRATSTGVDGTYVDAFIAQYSSNNSETNAIQTAVSSVAGNSGFRFQVSNGGGSSARTSMMDITRSGASTRLGFTIFGAAGGYTTGDNPFLGIGGTGADTFGVINAPFGDKMKLNAYHGFEFKTSNNGASGTPVLKATISTEGYLRLASSGIQFNGDTAAANALNDYEEGTFTPSLAIGGSSTGITYTVRRGDYTKVGRLVTIQLGLKMSSIGSNTGNLTITGLPFSVISDSYYHPYGVVGVVLNPSLVPLYALGAGSEVNFRKADTVSDVSPTNSDIDNDTYIFVTMTYSAS